MINIKTVVPGSTLCYIAPSWLGPFSITGELYDTFEYRSTSDYLRERPGIFGDNHVSHRSLNAELYEDIWRDSPSTSINLYTLSTSGSLGTRKQYGVNPSKLSPATPWHVTDQYNGVAAKPSPGRLISVTLNGLATKTLGGVRMTADSARIVESTVQVVKGQLPTVRARTWMVTEDVVYHGDNTPSNRVSFARRMYNKRSSKDLRYDDETPVKQLYGCKAPSGTTPVNLRDANIVIGRIEEQQADIPLDVKSFGDLSTDAIATLDTNSINMFEFIQGLKNPKQLLPKLKELNKLKTHAGNYLGVQYGVLPTISDLKELLEIFTQTAQPYFDVNNYQVLTAGHSVAKESPYGSAEVTNRLKIAVNPANAAMSTLSEKLRDMGGFPSINNLWELVPYSFVIDWFINVGDLLESVDTRFRMDTLPIVYATTSSKLVIEPLLPETLKDVGLSGTVQLVLYDRAVSSEAPRPTLNFEVSNELPSHWLEAGALIVTARK